MNFCEITINVVKDTEINHEVFEPSALKKISKIQAVELTNCLQEIIILLF